MMRASCAESFLEEHGVVGQAVMYLSPDCVLHDRGTGLVVRQRGDLLLEVLVEYRHRHH